MRWFLACAVLVVVGLILWRGEPRERASPARTAPDEEAASDPVGIATEPTVPESPPVEPVPPAAAGAQLAVRVVDPEGTPIEDAWIEVREDEDGPVRSTTRTDGAGRAVVLLRRRRDHLLAGARGFERLLLDDVFRYAERGLERTITLRPGYRIGGLVVDEAGAPVKGARVVLDESPVREVTVGEDGRFEFEGVAPEEATLRASAPGFLKEMVLAGPGDVDVKIVLQRPLTLRGVVVFPDGSPAAGARIRPRTLTDAEGRFALEGRRAGTIDLWVTYPPDRRWAAHEKVSLAADGSHPPLRILLQEGRTSCVLVRVLDKDGKPAAGLEVAGNRGWKAVTGPDGRARCDIHLPPGSPTSVSVRTRQEGVVFAPEADAVTELYPGRREVLLRPRKPRLVTVIVRQPDGSALPAQVTAEFGGQAPVSREHDRATFAFSHRRRTLLVRVGAAGYGWDFLWDAPIPDDGVAEVRLPGVGTIRCRVVGIGMEEAHVHASGGAWQALTEDGVCLLRDVTAGRKRVTVRVSGVVRARVETDVRHGEVVDVGTLALKEPRVVTGRVTDSRGSAVGGARVRAREGDETYAEAWSHADGSFRLVVPAWYDGRVLAQKPGHGVAHVPVSGQVEVALPPEGCARVRVRFLGERTAWTFVARDPETGFTWSPNDWRRIEEGTYLVEGLPPGRLVLAVQGRGRGETEVVVVPGETVAGEVTVVE